METVNKTSLAPGSYQSLASRTQGFPPNSGGSTVLESTYNPTPASSSSEQAYISSVPMLAHGSNSQDMDLAEVLPQKML